MSRLPLPEGPDRETIRAKVQAATMTGAAPASVEAYLCVTVSDTGEIAVASNAETDFLVGLLISLTGRIGAGLMDDPEDQDAPRERPEVN